VESRENQDGKNKRKNRKEKKRERSKKKKKKPKKKIMEIKKIAKEWEIWNKVAKSEEEAKKFVPQRFHEWIHIFGKKASKRMLMKKIWNHAIEMKEGSMPRKEKVYLLSRKEREKMCEFIEKQLRKEYIRLLKLPQTASVFFVGNKNSK